MEAEDVFLCAKHATAVVQAKLGELRAKLDQPDLTPTLRNAVSRTVGSYLKQLAALHAAVRSFLRTGEPLVLSANGTGAVAGIVQEACRALLLVLADIADEVPGLEGLDEGADPRALAARVREQRAAKLAEDVDAMRRALATAGQAQHGEAQHGEALQALQGHGRQPEPRQEGGQGGGGGAVQARAVVVPGGAARPEALAEVIRRLAHQEQSFAFHVRLSAEVAERFGSAPAAAATAAAAAGASGGGMEPPCAPEVGPSGYSADNFAYGSTPYTSWLQVVQAAGDAAHRALAPPGREYVVWGSSCGWLVAFGALTFGWRSRGVEILRCLHGVAQEHVAGVAAAGGGGEQGASPLVSFTCGDLLRDDVSRAGVVLLADQCWDEQLAAEAGRKLGRELPPGALCITYTSAERLLGQRGAERGAVGMPEGGGWEELAAVRVPVSWNAGQVMRVLRRVGGQGVA